MLGNTSKILIICLICTLDCIVIHNYINQPRITPLTWHLIVSFRLTYDTKKAQVSVLLPILEPKAFALPTSHRIDNAVSPRQNELYIIKVYRNAPRRRFGCLLPAVMLRVCEVLGSQRQTFENVFLIYKTAFHPQRVNERCCKNKKYYWKKKEINRFFIPKLAICIFNLIFSDTNTV